MLNFMSDSPIHASAKLTAWLAQGARGVAITGASGWVGRAMSHCALQALGPDAGDRLRLFGSRAGTLPLAGQALPLESLDNPAPLGPGEWIVLHLAVSGADRIADLQANRARNEAMLAQALALAGSAQVRRFVSASSGAVYAPPQAAPDKQAYCDLKRDTEQVARAWSGKTGVPLLIPRIFNIGGPYMNHAARYALGDMIQQARAGGVIRIQASKPVLRSYVHVLELARVVFDLALEPQAAIVFDTAGEAVVEMADLARAVGRALDLPGLHIERPPLAAEGEDRYVGDGAIYRSALSGPAVGLDVIIRDTAAWLGAESAA